MGTCFLAETIFAIYVSLTMYSFERESSSLGAISISYLDGGYSWSDGLLKLAGVMFTRGEILADATTQKR